MKSWLALIAVLGCKFEPGKATATVEADAPPAALDDARPLDGIPDSVPLDARVCPAAPTGCTAFTCPTTSSCYYLCGTTNQTKASWTGAAGACTNGNLGCIVTINDQAEQNCIVTSTLPTFVNSNYVWFGFRQSPNTNEPAGNWGWQCGTSTYVSPNWGFGEPNDSGGNEDCAAMTDGGGWFDATCSGTARYVCELP